MFAYILVVYTMYSSFVLAYFKREGEKNEKECFSKFFFVFLPCHSEFLILYATLRYAKFWYGKILGILLLRR